MQLLFRALLGLLLPMLASAALAQSAPLAGVDYYDLGKPAVTQNGAIEVVEYFWYRCPHCYALEPLLAPWSAKLPQGVEFRRAPAVLGKEWLLDAKVFYSLEALGELKRLHTPYLVAANEKGARRLNRDAYVQWAADWLATQGVDKRRFEEVFHSSAVEDKADQAYELSKKLQLEGTPTFMVAGRYLVSPPAGDLRQILSIVDYLINQVRAKQLARR